MKWYVVHTYASHEYKIKELIEKGIKGTDLEAKIGQILIPTQVTYQIREGRRIERERKVFTSYIIVEADLTSEVQNFILKLPGVTNFLGTGRRAEALPESEIKRLLGIADRDNEETKGFYEYLPGDIIKIIDGAFSDFEGVVEKYNAEQAKLTVKVTVFGRITPVEVNADQVEKINR